MIVCRRERERERERLKKPPCIPLLHPFQARQSKGGRVPMIQIELRRHPDDLQLQPMHQRTIALVLVLLETGLESGRDATITEHRAHVSIRTSTGPVAHCDGRPVVERCMLLTCNSRVERGHLRFHFPASSRNT